MHEEIHQKMVELGLIDLVGGGEPAAIGAQNLEAMTRMTGLRPDMRVLDFGCGCGRVALPVLDFLSPEGEYVGVDIVPRLVGFCEAEIASLYPNARFHLSVDNNPYYARFIEPGQSEIPVLASLSGLGEKSFDLIVAFSVFTHLPYNEACDYFKQLAALLRPGGELLVSCFLVNESSRLHIKEGRSRIEFGRTVFRNKKDYLLCEGAGVQASGFRDETLTAMARAAGLDVLASYNGSWCGRSRRFCYQDLMVFRDTPRLPGEFNAATYLAMHKDLPWSPDEHGLKEAERHYLSHGYFESRKWKQDSESTEPD